MENVLWLDDFIYQHHADIYHRVVIVYSSYGEAYDLYYWPDDAKPVNQKEKIRHSIVRICVRM